MNKFLAVLFAALFTVSLNTYAEIGGGGGGKYKSNGTRLGGGQHNMKGEGPLNDSLLGANAHVFPYVPKDLHFTESPTLHFCNADGQEISSYNRNSGRYSSGHDQKRVKANCYFYTSASDRSIWRIAYGGPQGAATHVFRKSLPEEENYPWELRAQFNDDLSVAYASQDAVRFANEGRGYARLKTEPGQNSRENQQVSRQDNDPAKEASKINASDLIKKGLGVVLPNLPRF